MGWPVVPLVQTTATGSDEASCGQVSGGSSAHQLRTSARVTTSTVPASGGRPASGSSTRRTGAARSTMEATSPAPMRGLMPEVMAPSRSSAAYETA